MTPLKDELKVKVHPTPTESRMETSNVGRVVLYCIALASFIAALFAMLFETGNVRELAIFVTAFGIPTIPFACMEYANRLAVRVADRRFASATNHDDGTTRGLTDGVTEPGVAIGIRMAGLAMGIAGGVLCLYVLVTSLAIRANEPKRRRPVPPMEMQTAALATRPGPALLSQRNGGRSDVQTPADGHAER